MIAADVISRVKRSFGDESGAQITDDDILRWITDGQNEVAQLHGLLETQGTTYTVAGIPDYDLPDALVALLSVYVADEKVKNLSTQEFDEYIRKWNDGNQNGVTTYVYTSWGNKISLFPTPQSQQTLVLKFTCFPAPVDSSASELNVPLRYHNRVVEYVMQQAYELDENFEAATMKGNQFADRMSQELGDEQWDEQGAYPTILVRTEDAG